MSLPKAFLDGWWLPLTANGYPRKGFLWGTRKLPPEEAHSLFERGQPLGLRPASLGLVCVDVDRAGGRDVMLQELGTDPITYYTTSQDWKSHNYYRPNQPPDFAYKKWSHGELFGSNYVYVRQPRLVCLAYVQRHQFPAIDPLALVSRSPLRQEDHLTSIAPKFPPAAQEYGQQESLAERRFKKKLRQVDVNRLFGEGKSQRETADILKVAKRTIQRDWKELGLSRYQKSDIR